MDPGKKSTLAKGTYLSMESKDFGKWIITFRVDF